MMSTLRQARQRTKSTWSKRGIAAVEFALTAPLWATMFLGAADGAYYLLASEKTDRIAYSVTDIVTQNTSVSRANLNDILVGATQLMDPMPFSTKGVVIISSVYKPAGGVPTVMWQYTGGGSLSAGSKVGTTGGTATLPNGLVLNDNDNVIVSEVYYKHEPLFVYEQLFSISTLYRTAVYKPRLSALTTPPA